MQKIMEKIKVEKESKSQIELLKQKEQEKGNEMEGLI